VTVHDGWRPSPRCAERKSCDQETLETATSFAAFKTGWQPFAFLPCPARQIQRWKILVAPAWRIRAGAISEIEPVAAEFGTRSGQVTAY